MADRFIANKAQDGEGKSANEMEFVCWMNKVIQEDTPEDIYYICIYGTI